MLALNWSKVFDGRLRFGTLVVYENIRIKALLYMIKGSCTNKTFSCANKY